MIADVRFGVMRKKVQMMVRRLLRFAGMGRVVRGLLGEGMRGFIFVYTSYASGCCCCCCCCCVLACVIASREGNGVARRLNGGFPPSAFLRGG